MFGKTNSFYVFFLVQIGSLIWAQDVAKKSKSDVKVRNLNHGKLTLLVIIYIRSQGPQALWCYL